VIWVPLGVWIGGVVLAAVVLTFSAYELTWKARRLRTDLDRLNALSQRLTTFQAEVAATAERASRLSQS
jgi:hypothetical protein